MRQRLIALGVILLALTMIIVVIQRSLPGDLVYAMKTNVIERSVGFLHFSVKNHTRYEVQTLQERLHEALLVLRTPTRSNNSIDTLAIHIEQNAESILQGMREQSGTDDAEVADLAVRMSGMISAYNGLFRSAPQEGIHKLLGVMERLQANIRKTGEKPLHAIAIGASGIDTQVVASASIQSAKAALKKAVIANDSPLTAKFSAATDALTTAESAWNEKHYSEAFELGNRAKSLAVEIHILRDASLE